MVCVDKLSPSSILAISFNKKLCKDRCGFWYLFWNDEKVETGHFSGGETEKGNRVKMVEISFLSKDSPIIAHTFSLFCYQMFCLCSVPFGHHFCFFLSHSFHWCIGNIPTCTTLLTDLLHQKYIVIKAEPQVSFLKVPTITAAFPMQ